MVQLSPSTVAKGVGVYFAAAVGGYLYLRSAKAPAPTPCRCGGAAGGGGAADQCGASGQQAFDRLADTYDACINTDETFMGLKLMRRWLMRKAQGDVLEVSAGTGRNLPYYDLAALRSLTLTDTSRAMLVNAADKLAALHAPAGAAPVRFELADAQRLTAGGGAPPAEAAASGQPQQGERPQAAAEPPQGPEQVAGAPQRPPLRSWATFAPRSFDVVVDTFGLCSQQDPVTALKEMARVCRPGGRILLLQHGRASWEFVNRVLDSGADQHFAKWGCWWNRDIERIVRQAGLEVESLSRWHFGTTYLVVARPPAGEG